MKKFLSLLLVMILAVSCIAFTGCKKDDEETADLVVGAIMVGDETEGYTEAHMEGINAAVQAMKAEGKTVKVIWKKKTAEDETCATAARDLVAQGCTMIISNSYSHQDYMLQVAKETGNENITFIAMTGDKAAGSKLANYKNAFTKVYESRYVSGVVAGMKLKELVDAGDKIVAKNMDGGNIKIGYVGAFPYAEVVSGYTAFYLGVKSIVPNVVMDVTYTNEWFHYDKEYQAAKAFIADGCVIVGQHADSEGAPTACEEEFDKGTICYSVGYNVDMLEAAPDAALTSATNTWSVYYTYAFKSALAGETIVTDWAKGYNDGAVAITKLGDSCATGTQKKVDDTIAAIKNGTLKVFDCSTFTKANGDAVTSYTDSFGMNGAECIKTEGTVKYFDESTLRAAPYFDIRIAGITEPTAA